MKKLGQEKGITLIALIVTIIILLILASVTISILLGKNGLLNTVKEAAIKQKMAEETELIKVSYAGLDIDYRVFDTEIKAKKLEEEINHSKVAKVEEVESMPENGILVDNGVTEGILCKVTMEYEYYIYLPGVALEAGLWKDGSLVYSWQELKDINWLTVDEVGNARLTNNPALMDGDLVVHQEVTTLAGIGGGYTNLLSIKTLGVIKKCTNFGGIGSTGLVKLDLNCEDANLEYAFQSCTNLKEVNIKGSVANMYGTFMYCTSLEEVVFDCSIGTIDGAAFSTETKKLVFNKHVEKVGFNIFQQSSSNNITEVIFNDGVDRIENQAFACKSLTKCIIKGECKYIGNRVFMNSSLTSFKIPEGIEEICLQTFLNNKQLEDIYIPDSVKIIGEQAFDSTSSLKQVTLPKNLISIGRAAFAASGLEQLVLPNSVTTVGEMSFYRTKIKTFECGSNIQEFGGGDFVGNTNLTKVKIDSNVCGGMFLECTNLQNVEIGENVNTIEVSAFSGCTGITDLQIPNTVTTIGENAFKNVAHVTYTGTAEGSPWGAVAVN